LHNTLKSDDDEFLLISLSGIISNNSVGIRHRLTKVDRALRRSAYRTLGKAMTMKSEEWVQVTPEVYLQIIWGTPDHDRLQKCFDQITRGLYFHHFGVKFSGRTNVMLGYTNEGAPNPAEWKRFIKAKVASELEGKARIGENPEVFTYLFTPFDNHGLTLAHLQFYGGLDVYVGLQPEGFIQHPTLMEAVMEMGIPVTLSVGDQLFTINKPAQPMTEIEELIRARIAAGLESRAVDSEQPTSHHPFDSLELFIESKPRGT
jgi:hypothetical protein